MRVRREMTTSWVYLMAALTCLVLLASPALGQQYGESTGDLTVTGTESEPGGTMSLQGDGFSPGAQLDVSVLLDASAQEISLGAVNADPEGRIDSAVDLPEDLEAGTYWVSVEGEGLDGGNRVLRGELRIGQLAEGGGSTLPFTDSGENTDAAGGSSTSSTLPLFIGGGAMVALMIGGMVWWRSRPHRR